MTTTEILSAMSPLDKGVVMAFAEANMKPGGASKQYHMSHNGVYYHLLSVKVKTGLDPKNFFDLCKLVEAITKERMEYDGEGT